MSYAMVSQSQGVGIEWHHALQRELGDEPVEGLVATYAGTGPEGLWARRSVLEIDLEDVVTR